MRNLNLDQLRSLIEVVELGSFTKAAERLHLTQSAISQQIRELERRCGLPLIERVGKSALATPAGRELIARGRRIIADTEHALAAVRHHRQGTYGQVHIGAGPTALNYLLPPILQELRSSHPDIEIVLTSGTTHTISEGLLSNVLDIGLTALPVEAQELDVVPVRTDPMVAILPATECAIPDRLTPADVAGRTLILEYQRIPHRHLSRAWLQAGGVEVRPAMEFDSIDAITRAVSAGLGMSIVPGPAVSHGPQLNSIVVRPLDPPLVRTLGLVQRRGRIGTQAVKLVCEAIMTLRTDDEAVPQTPRSSQPAAGNVALANVPEPSDSLRKALRSHEARSGPYAARRASADS